MTARSARQTLKDLSVGLIAFVLFGLVALAVLVAILRVTAPYGWNWYLLTAATMVGWIAAQVSSHRKRA
jgi:hypothetical protein